MLVFSSYFPKFTSIVAAGAPNAFAKLRGPTLGPSALPCTLSYYCYGVGGPTYSPELRTLIMAEEPLSQLIISDIFIVMYDGKWEKHEVYIGEQATRFAVSIELLVSIGDTE